MSEVMTETQRPASSSGVKRQYSREEAAEGEQESKRQRTSPGKNSPQIDHVEVEEVNVSRATVESEENQSQQQQPQDERTQITRRKAGAMDEKQRSKRLFGSLLGNLNRPSDRASQRRQEIEARRKAELQRQDDERLEEKNRRLERLAEHRREIQKAVDKENTRMRHAQLLSRANFLQTTSEPKLYYRPWELRDEEEDRIDQQMKDAKALIARETEDPGEESTPVAAFPGGNKASENPAQEDGLQGCPKDVNGEQSASTNKESGLSLQDASINGEDETLKSGHDPDSSAEVANSQPETDPLTSGMHEDESRAASVGHLNTGDMNDQKHADDEGDHIVEGGEDTVIY